jgi:hypothetical protein
LRGSCRPRVLPTRREPFTELLGTNRRTLRGDMLLNLRSDGSRSAISGRVRGVRSLVVPQMAHYLPRYSPDWSGRETSAKVVR